MAAHRLVKLVASALVFLAVGRAGITAAPLLRHYLVAVLNDPEHLPALETDPRVHFEPSARGCAMVVAELLPSAVARIEEAQGRPFRPRRRSASTLRKTPTPTRTGSKTRRSRRRPAQAGSSSRRDCATRNLIALAPSSRMSSRMRISSVGALRRSVAARRAGSPRDWRSWFQAAAGPRA